MASTVDLMENIVDLMVSIGGWMASTAGLMENTEDLTVNTAGLMASIVGSMASIEDLKECKLVSLDCTSVNLDYT